MLVPLLSLSISAVQTGQVTDYFPLVAGSKWTYSSIKDGVRSQLTFSTGAPVKIGKQMTTPMLVSSDSGGGTTLYYRIEGQAAVLVADDPTNPYDAVRPVLVLDAPNNKWRYDYLQNEEPVNVNAEITRRSTEVVLGQRRDVVEVHMKALVGGDRHPLQIDETLLYAKGVGLAKEEIRQVAQSSKDTMELMLTDFQPGKTAGS